MTFIINCSELRESFKKSNNSAVEGGISEKESLESIVESMIERRIRSVTLSGACDNDLTEIVNQISGKNHSTLELKSISIHHSNITDKGMECLLTKVMKTLSNFELIGCNEISDSGLWTGLVPNLKSLTIQDCINVSDETIANICQLLTSLHTFNLQVCSFVLHNFFFKLFIPPSPLPSSSSSASIADSLLPFC